MAKWQYLTATNWGKGFITVDDSSGFGPTSFPGNVWRVPANHRKANAWIKEVLGEPKTKDEAQALVDAEVQNSQNTWDALPSDDPLKTTGVRPEDITLEE
tara:strand:- start:1532 stop:1831 length:300 start_codon:yes stop_codon:yes gene_type:complete